MWHIWEDMGDVWEDVWDIWDDMWNFLIFVILGRICGMFGISGLLGKKCSIFERLCEIFGRIC